MSSSRRTTESPSGFPTYKYVGSHPGTVETVLQEAVDEVKVLIDECRYAASRYPTAEHPLSVQFEAAAQALEGVYNRLALVVLLPKVGHLPVEYRVMVCRRQAHQVARWARAGNCALGLRAVALTLIQHGLPSTLADVAELLLAVDFPTRYA